MHAAPVVEPALRVIGPPVAQTAHATVRADVDAGHDRLLDQFRAGALRLRDVNRCVVFRLRKTRRSIMMMA